MSLARITVVPHISAQYTQTTPPQTSSNSALYSELTAAAAATLTKPHIIEWSECVLAAIHYSHSNASHQNRALLSNCLLVLIGCRLLGFRTVGMAY